MEYVKYATSSLSVVALQLIAFDEKLAIDLAVLFFIRGILLPRTQSPERDVHQYYSLAGFSRAACNVFFNQRAEPYLFGLCRSDGEIRAAKRHRRLEGSLQVHAVILSGYTETRRRSQSGSCGFATAKRIGTGGTKTGEKRDTDLEAEMGGNHRSCQHRRECRFSFRQQQGQDAGKG